MIDIFRLWFRVYNGCTRDVSRHNTLWNIKPCCECDTVIQKKKNMHKTKCLSFLINELTSCLFICYHPLAVHIFFSIILFFPPKEKKILHENYEKKKMLYNISSNVRKFSHIKKEANKQTKRMLLFDLMPVGKIINFKCSTTLIHWNSTKIDTTCHREGRKKHWNIQVKHK